MKRLILFLTILASCTVTFGQAGVFDPNDPIVNYNAASPPPNPTLSRITKWVRTPRVNWDASQFKSYIFQGVQFRVMFPKTYQHNVSDGKVYPATVFLHGLGERGSAFDNEYQLLHGGQTFRDRVNNGTYDGFLIYPQFGANNSGWGSTHFATLARIIDSMAKYVKVDVDRVMIHGLSIGGQGTWKFIEEYPRVFAGAQPISGASLGYIPGIPKYLEIPIRLYTGDKDNNPTPGTSVALVDSFRNRGGNIVHTRYPTQGHGCWNTAWAEAAWVPFMNNIHKANPIVYFGRSEFCPGDPVNTTLALTAGFSAYEWEKDGVVIPGATSNKLVVTTYGTYRARFRRTATGNWSAWSPTPVVVRIKPTTLTPPIQIQGMFSNVLPASDGKTTVPLSVAGDYTGYEWRRVSDNAIVSTAKVFEAPAGTYRLRVTELYGCSSEFSANYTVVNANGVSGLPDAAGGLLALGASKTTMQVDWSDNPTPANNETGFEVYRSTTAGGPYTLIGKTAADQVSFLDQGLNPNTSYYYIVRAVNANGASSNSAEATGKTQVDDSAPNAPQNLVITTANQNSISLQWNESTDDVGVDKYDIFVDGLKSYTTSSNYFTVPNLNGFQTYNFQVRARDAAGNLSPLSSQITGQAAASGLSYKLYNGSWSVLPNFATLTPVQTGRSANVDITLRNQTNNYAFLWEGTIKVPVSGSYTFETCSDDGSKLYIGTYNHTATALVNNDGAHGNQCRTGTITLTAGLHPIAITYFQGGGGQSMQVWWQSAAAGIARQQIPSIAFDESVPFAGAAPIAPASVRASALAHNKVQINWTDRSDNETGFEVARSTSKTGQFITVGTVGANTTTFTDSIGLIASTRYFYKVRAIGQYGESAFAFSFAEARWRMNNNNADATGGANTITLANGAAYNTTAYEGSHSIFFDGTNDLVEVSGPNNFLKSSFNARTVSLWIRPELLTGTRLLFDFGGSDNGIAMRINANQLQAAVVNANTSVSVTTGFTAANTWSHVAMVYAGNTLRMYVNGVLAAENTNLSFSTVAATTNNSRLGFHNSGNAFRVNASAYYRGRMDDLRVIDANLSAAEIAQLMNDGYQSSDVITQVLPAVPAAATNLLATATGSNTVDVTWTDNGTNETGYDVYRSLSNNTTYRKIAAVAGAAGTGSTITFNDASLFSNAIYYYKVVATGVGGNAGDSNEDSAKTGNDVPVITAIANTTMKFGTIRNISINATDPNSDALFIAGVNLPSFATITDNGNGNAALTLSPQIGDMGTYTIEYAVTDNYGGVSTGSFTLLVDANNPPTLNPVVVSSVAEGSVGSFNISATDLDGQTGLNISATGLPSFVTLTDNGNGTAQLNVAPGYADGDTYNFTVQVADANGAIDTKPVSFTVTEVIPNERILVSIQRASVAPSPWNNVVGLNTNALRNTTGASTTVGLSFQTTAWNTFDQGPVTGNNSGLYPDAVIRDYYYFGIFGAPNTVNVRTTGLNPTKKYKFSFYAGSKWTGTPDNGTTTFTIGSQTVSQYVQNNNQNKVSIDNVQPDASGIVTFSMGKAAGTPAGYINALEIESAFDDGSAPAMPKGFAAALLPAGGVKLTWRDVAYNETGYEIYRSLEPNANFVLLNPGAANLNTTSYDDLTVSSSTTYYYQIRSVGSNGSSAYTPTVSVTTGNKLPVITGGGTLYVKTDALATLPFTAVDDAEDVLTVTASNLPAFATLVNNGGGSYHIAATPTVDNIGVYNGIVITVADDKGASVTRTVSISVSDKNTTAIFLNFGSDNMPAATPWNNLLGYPMGNKNIQNMRDENGALTTVDFSLVQQWTGTTDLGHITTENSGAFGDEVIRSAIYESSTNSKQVKFSGLTPGKLYNIAFLGSVNAGFDASATITSGTQSVQMQARYNNDTTTRLNGLVPDANGEIFVTITKNSTALYSYLNGLVIESYDGTVGTLAPVALKATPETRTSVSLHWSDRANNETGYELWRATAGGSYALIATLPANTTKYTDNTASASTRYFYVVRATVSGGGTEFSNAASVITPSNIVYLHLTNQYPAPAPWNNTRVIPQVGDRYENLNNDLGNISGVAVNLVSSFNGEFWAGMNTGNNSGIFPDPVLISSYWIDNGQKVLIRIDGLNQSLKYRLGFFASADWNYNLTTSYTVNGRVRFLNASKNTSRAEYIDEITPTNDGEIYLEVSTNSLAQFGFLSGLIIQGYSAAAAPAAPAKPVMMVPPVAQQKPGKVETATEARKVNVNAPEVATNTTVAAYPNPFRNEITFKLSGLDKAKGYQIQLLNANGMVIADRKANMAAGNTVNMNVSGLGLKPGMYMARVIVDGKVTKSIKLLKIE